jgi:YidC/Oxa1 family membrane protein insertase
VDKRALSATLLCGGVLLVWMLVVLPILSPRPKAPLKKASPPKSAATPPVAPTPPTPPPPEPAAVAYPELPPIRLSTQHYDLEFSNKGAGLSRLALRDRADRPPIELLKARPGVPVHLALRHLGGPEEIERLPWAIKEQTEKSIVFLYRLRSGVEIEKKFTISPDKRPIGLEITLNNRNPAAPGTGEPPAQELTLELLAFNGFEHDSPYRYDWYLEAFAVTTSRGWAWKIPDVEDFDGRLARARKSGSAKAIAEAEKGLSSHEVVQEGVRERLKAGFGIKNRYFAALVTPAPDSAIRPTQSVWSHLVSRDAKKEARNIAVSARTEPIKVGGQHVSFQYAAHIFPLTVEGLKGVPGDWSFLINYGAGCAAGCGWFSGLFVPFVLLINVVAPLILSLLNAVGGALGNYGIGIMVTTLLIRLLLFPLSKKSQVSMYKMQQLGPKITILRERYKDDQQKFGQEQMRLFKEHGINPMAGCLPIFLQMPIFVGMYSVFELSIDLRLSPFFGWIKDLSQPDMLLGPWAPWNFLIVDVSSLNLLPIVMTITWFLQSWFAPRSPDPNMRTQQKIFLFMPVVFGIMCYNLASGLSLYFLANSLLSMLEQKLIKKFFLAPREASSRP